MPVRIATALYYTYTGIDPFTNIPVHIAKSIRMCTPKAKDIKQRPAVMVIYEPK